MRIHNLKTTAPFPLPQLLRYFVVKAWLTLLQEETTNVRRRDYLYPFTIAPSHGMHQIPLIVYVFPFYANCCDLPKREIPDLPKSIFGQTNLTLLLALRHTCVSSSCKIPAAVESVIFVGSCGFSTVLLVVFVNLPDLVNRGLNVAIQVANTPKESSRKALKTRHVSLSTTED
jgi:hypothetical protein